jgi:hypothetical protein
MDGYEAGHVKTDKRSLVNSAKIEELADGRLNEE